MFEPWLHFRKYKKGHQFFYIFIFNKISRTIMNSYEVEPVDSRSSVAGTAGIVGGRRRRSRRFRGGDPTALSGGEYDMQDGGRRRQSRRRQSRESRESRRDGGRRRQSRQSRQSRRSRESRLFSLF